MPRLARCNLFHVKIRLAVTFTGVASAEKYFPRFAIWKRRRGVDESDWEAASMSVNYRGRRAAAVPGNPVRCWAAHETFPRTRWLT
jgi:hypothetical protein